MAGFLWGVAASAYQIEGAVAEGGRGASIWDTFSHTPGRVRNGDNGDVAIDHYHRYRQDVAIMADLGVDAYRFSLAWPRLLPSGVGEVNDRGVEFYLSLIEELRTVGITPFVTLYHWDLPQALQDRGGWLSPDSPEWFCEYAAVAKEHLGGSVRLWSTHNEPWCAAFLGHAAGVFAPGLADPAGGFWAAHHLMVAHHRAVSVLRETRPHLDDRVGIVLNLIPARPATSDPRDVEVAAVADAIHNHLFVDAALEGAYPEAILRLHRRFRVEVDPSELEEVFAPVDFLGINYYNINRFAFDSRSEGLGEFPGADGAVLVTPPGPLTDMGWGVEPEGLASVLGWIGGRYPDLALYVTENGAAYPDTVGPDGSVHDPERIDYLRRHIEVTEQAMAAGIDVRGYFAWSIFDNFEWAHGYSKRFGLVYVDYATLERTVKASGHWYRRFIASRREG